MATKETTPRTEVFAIKVPKQEKEAMNLIAQVTGKTLSKTFYRAIQHTIHTEFGKVLLDRISRPRAAVVSKGDDDGREVPAFLRRSAPMAVVDFVQLIQVPDTLKAFHALFDGLQFAHREWLLYEVSIDELTHHLGKTYLDADASLEPMDLDLARVLFFDYMVRATYQHTAMGLLHTLEAEWTKNRPKIEQFRDQLMAEYERRFEDAIEVEVVEVLPDDGPRRRR